MPSAIKEKFEKAAEKAEAENPDEPTEGEPTEPTEPAEPSPDEQDAEEAEESGSEAESAPVPDDPEAQKKAFDRAMRAFHGKLCAIFEVDDLVPVPTPGAVGFMLPGTFEQKTHDNFQRCTTCNGHGSILTGSFHVGDETATCPDGRCKGRGYWQRGAAVAPPEVTGPTTMPPPPAQDNGWGEAPAWMGDPSISSGTPA